MRFDDGEKIEVVIRKHWLVFAAALFIIGVFTVVPYVLIHILPAGIFGGIPASVAGPVTAFFYLLWLLILWVALFAFWTNYYLNIWIITDRRVIDIVQNGLFSRELITARLEKVQDVTTNTEGILHTLFDFGTVVIHTADDMVNIVITNAARPGLAREKILNAHAALLERAIHPGDSI